MSYDPTKPYKHKIKELIKSTWKTEYICVLENGVLYEKHTHPTFDHTDGIGTKGLHHWNNKTFKEAVTDAFAMNINDVSVMRGIPYKLQNHLIIPEDNENYILTILSHLVDLCKEYKIAITGGEVSIQNNINGIELSITMSSFIPLPYHPTKFKEGDLIVGLASSGLHSNGLTLASQYITDPAILTKPTKIYYNTVKYLTKRFDINAMCHITGGAYSRLKDLIENNNDMLLTLPRNIDPVFSQLNKEINNDNLYYSTFNSGIGYILSLAKDGIQTQQLQEGMYILGRVLKGKGNIVINSQFSDKVVTL